MSTIRGVRSSILIFYYLIYVIGELALVDFY